MRPSDVTNREPNDTSKGLDILLETSHPNIPPAFGNNQDLQFIFIGTRWCGSGM